MLKVILHKAVSLKFALDSFSVLMLHALVISATLYHESFNDTVEDKAREEATLCELYKICDCFRSFFGIEFSGHCSEVAYVDLNNGIVHFENSFRKNI